MPYFSFGFSNYILAITTMCTHLCVMATHVARVTRVTVKVIVGGFRIRPRINNEGCVVHCNSLASKDVFTNGREGGGAGSSAVLKLTSLRVCLCNPSKFFIVHLQKKISSYKIKNQWNVAYIWQEITMVHIDYMQILDKPLTTVLYHPYAIYQPMQTQP